MESLLQSAPYLLAFLAIFYFFLIRPQQQRARQTRDMHESITQNDVVLLNSGFEGKVRHIDDNALTIEIGLDSKVDVKVAKDFVVANISEAERRADAKKKADEEKAAKKASK